MFYRLDVDEAARRCPTSSRQNVAVPAASLLQTALRFPVEPVIDRPQTVQPIFPF